LHEVSCIDRGLGMTRRKFGLYINLGIEVNNSLLSGLANKLQESGEVVALVNCDNPLLDKAMKEKIIEKLK